MLLADEINRTPPKTQSALLEAMQELSVTVRGQHHKIAPPFFVLATQNPIELEGTYPLPEAQLDRFLFNVLLDYLSAEDEMKVVTRNTTRMDLPAINACTTPERDPEVPVAGAPGADVRRPSAARPWTWCAPRGPAIRTAGEIVKKYVQLRRQHPRHAVPRAGRQGARAVRGSLSRDARGRRARWRCRCCAIAC